MAKEVKGQKGLTTVVIQVADNGQIFPRAFGKIPTALAKGMNEMNGAYVSAEWALSHLLKCVD